MKIKALVLAFFMTVSLCYAQEVAIWQTNISDGDAKRAAMGSWEDQTRYTQNQDDNYTLLKRNSTNFQPISPDTPYTITIDSKQKYQTMVGYGASMTDASAFVLMQLKDKNPDLYEYTMTRLFDKDDGAGFSYLRKPLGSSDYTATDKYYSYCDKKSPNLTAFSIDHDKKYIIPALKEALRFNPEIKIMGSPWSPPAWMKTNNSLTGISKEEKASGKTCKLKPQYFDIYANYFVKIIEAYKNEGLNIHSITLQNEPQFDAAKYPCMRMDINDQIRLVSILGPKLKDKNLETKIFIHDHNWQLHPDDRKVIGGDAKMNPIDLCRAILNDPQASPHIAGTAWHCYSGTTRTMTKAYNTIHTEFPDKEIFCTEITGWGKDRGSWFGNIDWTMNHNWMGGPQNYASVSLQWNLALDHKYGPTLRDDSAALGIVTINTDNYLEVKLEREYYPMAQLSKAAQPGSIRIASEVRKQNTKSNMLDTLAFQMPDGKISLVVYNSKEDKCQFQVSSNGKYFHYTMPGRSIATFIWPE